MSNWQTVYKTDQLYKAEIVKDCLQNSSLHPIIVDKKDSAYLIGYYEIRVLNDNVLKALKLIEDDVKFE